MVKKHYVSASLARLTYGALNFVERRSAYAQGKGCGSATVAQEVKVLQFEFGGCNVDTRTFFRDFWHFFEERGFQLYRITPFGAHEIPRYKSREEYFSTTNYVAVHRGRT